MVKDPNKQPAFDAWMKKYDKTAPDKERIQHLLEGVRLRKASIRPKPHDQSVNA